LCYYTSEMCCPYFSPVRRALGSGGPLGDNWAGVCHANADAPEDPDPEALRRFCNPGYARGGCARFPEGDGPDAVRFAIWRDDGASISVRFAIERDHHPFTHGTLEYARDAAQFHTPPESALLDRQALAYIQGYRRRKGESAAA